MFQLSRFSRSFIIVVFGLILFTSLFILRRPILAYKDSTGKIFGEGSVGIHTSGDLGAGHSYKGIEGDVIMPKLENATAKAALGRATWKLLHTMTLRYPETPNEDERMALSSFFYLTSRLYPCGECAAEFQLLLKEYPPQTSSRKAASRWLCFLHNQVNERLGKPEFDCNNLDGAYDCGCGDQPVHSTQNIAEENPDIDLVRGG